MEKLKESLIKRLKLLKVMRLNIEDKLNVLIYKSCVLINAEKVFKCNYCINELQGMLEFRKISDSKN